MNNVRHRATGILTRNNGTETLVIKRVLKGVSYMELPGGGVEESESIETALVRELQEELTIDVQNWKQLKTTRETSTVNGEAKRHYYLITKYEGEPKPSPEMIEMHTSDNEYELVWLPISELKHIDIAADHQLFNEVVSLLTQG